MKRLCQKLCYKKKATKATETKQVTEANLAQV